MELQTLGWNPLFERQFSSLGSPDCIPARVAQEHKMRRNKGVRRQTERASDKRIRNHMKILDDLREKGLR